MQIYNGNNRIMEGRTVPKFTAKQTPVRLLLTVFVIGMAVTVSFAESSKPSMKGPRTAIRQTSSMPEIPTSCMQIAFQDTITFYQHWISPIGGNRCGFRPSCSRYGYTAVSTQGPVLGLMMTGDRLMRCNIWKSPGPDYFLLPNGRLFDPISKNLLIDP